MRALITALLVVVLLLLQWPLWRGEGSWPYVWHLREAVVVQKSENAQLLQRNRALEAEVKNLREGLDALEERARRDLGMIRPEETFFFLTRPPESPPPMPQGRP